MSTFEQSIPIVEGDAAKSLEAVLKKVAKLNEQCVVLVKHRFEKLKTDKATVVLVYEEGKCEKPTQEKDKGMGKGKGATAATPPAKTSTPKTR